MANLSKTSISSSIFTARKGHETSGLDALGEDGEVLFPKRRKEEKEEIEEKVRSNIFSTTSTSVMGDGP